MNKNPIDHLIKMLSGLPGLGGRSARRIALHLLAKRSSLMIPLAAALKQAAEEIKECTNCGNLDMVNPCAICQSAKRDRSTICVVTSVSDVWAIEKTGSFKGLYHVLGGLLSALDGIGPGDLRIAELQARIAEGNVQEVILGLSATVDGQSTAHYIADHIDKSQIKVTQLSHGVPVGGELDYLDDGTITTALRARKIA